MPLVDEEPDVIQPWVEFGMAEAEYVALLGAPLVPPVEYAGNGAVLSCKVHNGELRFYKSKRLFAYCDRHTDCRLTRTCNESNRMAPHFSGHGRPVGFLVAWLRMELPPDQDDAANHISLAEALMPTLEARKFHRVIVERIPEMKEILEVERPR